MFTKDLQEFQEKYTGEALRQRMLLLQLNDANVSQEVIIANSITAIGNTMQAFNAPLLAYRLQLAKRVDWIDFDALEISIKSRVGWITSAINDYAFCESTKDQKEHAANEAARAKKCISMLYDPEYRSPLLDFVLAAWRDEKPSHNSCVTSLIKDFVRSGATTYLQDAAKVLLLAKDVLNENDWRHFIAGTMYNISVSSNWNVGAKLNTWHVLALLAEHGITMDSDVLHGVCHQALYGVVSTPLNSSKPKRYKVAKRHAQLIMPAIAAALSDRAIADSQICIDGLKQLCRLAQRKAPDIIHATIVASQVDA